LASPIEETTMSSRLPGLAKAGMSAVTITTATFLAERVVLGTVKP
jgi:transketolase C-terminal domain/subunit